MQSIIIKANQNFLDEAIKLLQNLAKEQNQDIQISQEPRSYGDDEIYAEVMKRSEAIHSGTAKLIYFDDFKKDMSEFLKSL